MWFLIPFIMLGVAMYAAGRDRGASAPLPQRMLPPPPGPISVLGEFVRIGQIPPPPVILCAIAEAESIGRCDLATDIIRIFVAPVVQAQQQQQSAPMPPPRYRPQPSTQPSTQPSPPHAPPVVQERVYPPSYRQSRNDASPSNGRGNCNRPRSPQHSPRAQASAPQESQRRTPTIDEIQQMLDTDPERAARMFEAAMQGVQEANPAMSKEAELAMLNVVADATGEKRITPEFAANVDAFAYGLAKLMHTPLDQLQAEADAHLSDRPAGDLNTQPGSEWDQRFPAGHVLSEQPIVVGFAVTEPTTASPVAGISDEAWSHFCGKLVRETPAYQSARHVGQYRQRRERLVELGIDPNGIVGSPEMQRRALDADLADAYRHAADDASGLVRNVSRKIMLPNGEHTAITLSGVLGVIQAAGLEGAAGWLEDHRDRKKFPHTTQAFMRCNGVF